MTTCIETETGWGAGWGGAAWGGGASEDLALIAALSVRTNAIRLTFNTAPVFTGLLDMQDASGRHRYSITPVVGTVGYDGLPVRPVAAVYAEQVKIEGALGRVLDVYLDRPMSPYPARYVVAVNNLFAADSGLALNACATSMGVFGLGALIDPPALDTKLKSRDIANPQTLAAMLDPLPDAPDPLLLGSIPTDANGDYAFDEGITNLKKRIYRRLVTPKGRYAHLPGYGVGVLQLLKKLGQAGVRAAVAADAEAQIQQEPDVVACRVRIENTPGSPGLVRFIILVKMIAGTAPAKFEVAFPAV